MTADLAFLQNAKNDAISLQFLFAITYIVTKKWHKCILKRTSMQIIRQFHLTFITMFLINLEPLKYKIKILNLSLKIL